MTQKTIEKYMQLVTKTENPADTRTLYHVGDNFIVEATRVTADLSRKNSLMNIWKESGYIHESLPSYIVISTYYTDGDGNCWGWYNVTEKLSEDKKRHVIDFDYLLEATEENERQLVTECIRMREMGIKMHR